MADWLYGFHAVESALRNDPAHIDRVLIEAGRRDARMRDLESLIAQVGCPVETLAARDLERRCGSPRHQGIAAAYSPAPALGEADLDSLLAELREPPFLLVLDGVTDPHNLGACLRSAEAAGVHAVIAPRDRAAGLTPAARKVAAGSAERLPFVQVTNLVRTLERLKTAGIWILGAAGEGALSLYESRLADGPLALVMGAEGSGLRRLTREACDELIRIPMAGTVESLNVSVATGVCLFELRRRRQAAQA
ncbi:MAG: 23S rRNA (guanosine(2251)-2'-O)-methyltransferase RlmB [Halothiobacillaceae bacterium]|mgnify:CR=1 FL=1|jgi:23S rRNA (guanosine2251-2'-O)-methyltransferase|nr:23S rRNA (guanosine(2251)-2'-O)-methyltransferase RlmB [Halothiobacillaceae bacterium]MDY0049414.1 23S rRNA (guanosine(2251)-2'-O)-methyltransferase RlmB [Halothiobacillaceae bacterium]